MIFAAALCARAEDAPAGQGGAKFLGSQACSTSGCHGGAGEKNRQFTVWAKYDVHHERPFATLTTARAERIAETLKLGDAATSARCTVCHAPFQTVPAERLDHAAKISEGVSCESCHGAAENWLLSHTRSDYTHADRVHAGMRDLQNLYVRANTCVACHQNVDADILAAGHPELIFELDGQCVTQPKHWRETTNFNGAQAWLVGQAVALREMSWQLSNQTAVQGSQGDRWTGLFKTLSVAAAVDSGWPSAPAGGYSPVQKWSAEFARSITTVEWTDSLTRKCLKQLATGLDFFNSNRPISNQVLACEAERLVLALDRLVTALPEAEQTAPLKAALKKLFADAQSLPDFHPAVFAGHLAEFQKALPKE